MRNRCLRRNSQNCCDQKDMKTSFIRSFFIILTVLSLCLCACEEEPVPKKSFGEVDALTDGAVLISDTAEEDAGDEQELSNETATSDSTIKTSLRIDTENLTPAMKKMVGLCDAINMAGVEMREIYSFEDPDFVWHCVHLYVCNCTDKNMGFKRVIYAMFGKLSKVPDVPFEAGNEDLEDDEPSHVRISNNLKYRFLAGDRGLSACEVRRVVQYSDGSLEMEIALVDSESGEETVSFIYTMRANTRNTTTSAVFDYEITGARPADKTTRDKIDGMPFVVPIIQVYGYDSYTEEDPEYYDVEEVLYFNSFAETDEEMDKLNGRISDEILAYANSPCPEGSWHEICSYPLTTYDYVQFATTFATYPVYAQDPDIRCYNYSKNEKRAMDENDAYALCNMSGNTMAEHVRSLWKPSGAAETLTDVIYKGFLVRRDGSTDVFFTINVNNTEAEPYSRLMVYNSGSDDLRWAFDEGGIVPEEDEDAVKPKLTHGRKDK